MLTVIASIEHELAGLRKELHRRQVAGGVSKPVGRERPVLDLQVVGVGKDEASATVGGLFAGEEGLPRRLLLLGFAGAVDPSLRSGDLVLSSRYYREEPVEHLPSSHEPIDETGVEFLTPDPKLWTHALRAVEGMDRPVVYSDSVSTARLVGTPGGKLAIKRRYPVGVVNMEDYWVAAAAWDAGVPFIAARAVLDPAHLALPGYLLGLAGSSVKAAFIAAGTPWRIPTMVGLARRMTPAQQALTSFALKFAAEIGGAELTNARSPEATAVVVSGSGLESAGQNSSKPRLLR